MVSLQRFRMLTLCGLALLAVSAQVHAQNDFSEGIASTEYAPLREFSVFDGGYQNTPLSYGSYSTLPNTAYVARHINPGCPGCPGCPSAGSAEYPMTPSQEVCGTDGLAEYTHGAGAAQQCYSPRPCCAWYASVAGLYMDRNRPRRVWTTYENNNNSNQLMNTQNANPDWEGGADLRIGRFFACNRWVLELGYWSINNFTANSRQTHVNEVSSPLQFNDLEFAFGDPVADYFDSAAEHRLSRTNELHNVELNIIEGRPSCTVCSRWSHRMLVGVRYFKFDEDLSLATLNSGGMWGGNGGLDEVELNDRVKNNLVGAQLGCLFERQVGCKTRFFLSPKFGVYGNRIEHRFDLRRGDGTAAMPTAFSGVTGSYPVESSTDVVSFLTEASIGLQHQLSCCWSIFGGYRVVVLNNIGLADNQIPQFIVDIPEIADIDTDGSLVLQGAFLGASRTF